ncbi:MAG: hypothetical protein BGO96_16475 [Micrococcales bacterium 73-15]|uniref:DUF4192 family protein n=1 Tax=Salana multivorans TaxID=120377 RepID=UPI00096279A9|nr:DUF4192 family protein [Salana multivorans]OJX94457.1 MAG: hypothetical protein BGO96_16475 [Micrococcales bacterium 73-15]
MSRAATTRDSTARGSRAPDDAGLAGAPPGDAVADGVPVLDAEPVLRATGVEEVLSYVPHALGFHPESSVVLISLRPPRGRLGLTMRCDLEPLASPRAGDLLAALASHVRADGGTQVFCVVYAPGTVARARCDPRVRAAVGAVTTTPDLPAVREVWLVTSTGYGAFDCNDEECCPARGRDLRELTDTRVAAELTLRGSSPRPSREALAPARSTSGPGRRSFGSAFGRARLRVGDGMDGGRPIAALVAEAVETLGSATSRPSVLGRLAALLAAPRLRDAVLLAIARAAPGEWTDPTAGVECAPGTGGAERAPRRLAEGAGSCVEPTVAGAPPGSARAGEDGVEHAAGRSGPGGDAVERIEGAEGAEGRTELTAAGVPPGGDIAERGRGAAGSARDGGDAGCAGPTVPCSDPLPDAPGGWAAFSRLLEPGVTAPDPGLLRHAVGVVEAAASFAKPSVRADLCAILAWLHWWRGDGAAAALAAREAVRLDPGQRLAGLVAELLRHGVAPGWALPAATA